MLDLSQQSQCEGSYLNHLYYYGDSLKLQTKADNLLEVSAVSLDSTHYLLNSDGTFSTLSTLNPTKWTKTGTSCKCENHIK